jgi:hypothetical protein
MSDKDEYESEFTRFYDMLGEEERKAEALAQQQPPPAPAPKEEAPQESWLMKYYLSLADDEIPPVVSGDSPPNNKADTPSNRDDGAGRVQVAAQAATKAPPGNAASAAPQPYTNSTNATEASPPRAIRAHHVMLRPNDRVVTIEYDNGPAEIRWGGSRTWRNHNPGNLVPGDLATFEDAIGRDDQFAIFPDDETGTNAMYGLIYELRDAGRTVDQAIAIWAPPSENDTPRYIADVHSWTGFTGSERLIDLTDAQIDSFAAAIRRREGWTPGHVAYDE